MQQVTYGTFKYKKMLKIFLSSLYFKHGGESQRADYTLYMVFGYIALLRLHELGFQDFRELVLSQEHFKMSVLLKFLFSAENLQEWLRPEWIKLYDTKFVDEQLIEKVLVFVPNVEALQKVLEGRMASEAAKKEAAAEAARALAEGRGGGGVHTTPEPFALTQPKMRLVPPPEETITPFKVARAARARAAAGQRAPAPRAQRWRGGGFRRTRDRRRPPPIASHAAHAPSACAAPRALCATGERCARVDLRGLEAAAGPRRARQEEG